jgi:hypothetical protein
MNILFWVFQILLAAHTIMGAIWKFFNSEQFVPSLKAIPHIIWQSLSIIEILCGLALIIPLFAKKLGLLVPIAALVIAAEMIIFCVLFLFSGDTDFSHVIYWLVVAIISGFIAYGRLKIRPI